MTRKGLIRRKTTTQQTNPPPWAGSYTTSIFKQNTVGPVGIVFANGPRDLGSIPDRLMPKTLKWYWIPPCLTLSNITYLSRVKWSNPEKGVALYPTPWCSSYWKGSLLVALDHCHQQVVWIQSFPSSRQVPSPRLDHPVSSNISP